MVKVVPPTSVMFVSSRFGPKLKGWDDVDPGVAVAGGSQKGLSLQGHLLVKLLARRILFRNPRKR